MKVLADALQVAKRLDLLERLHENGKTVEHEAFAILKFGTDNMYHISTLDVAEYRDASVPTARSMSVPFIALYAFPHLVVTLAQLLGRAAVQKHRVGELGGDGFAHLSSILLDAIEQLPKSSRAMRAARRDLEAVIGEVMAWQERASCRHSNIADDGSHSVFVAPVSRQPETCTVDVRRVDVESMGFRREQQVRVETNRRE